MKELYTFPIQRKIEKTIPFIKKKDNGETVESTKIVTETEDIRIAFLKPSMYKIEEAEFFYGQKFNEFINSGFLTRAMLNKKMGDIGGFTSKTSLESLQKAFVDNYESSRVIEFYSDAKDLTDEQKDKLDQARHTFADSKNKIFEYEQALQSQFSQTADAKAEQKLIEWLVFNLSFYEESINSKKELFPIFKGDDYNSKRELYLKLCDDLDPETDAQLIRLKSIFDKSFTTLVRVASIWYNKIADSQEDIDNAIKDMFIDDVKIDDVKIDDVKIDNPEDAKKEKESDIKESSKDN